MPREIEYKPPLLTYDANPYTKQLTITNITFMKKFLLRSLLITATMFFAFGATSCSDDDEIQNGGNGGNTDLSKITLADILKAEPGQHEVEGVTVVATNEQGLIVTEGEASMYVFVGEAHNLVAGDVVTLSGETSLYNNLLQFGKGTVVTKTGTGKVKNPTPTAMEAADLADYAKAPCYKYASFKGMVMVAGQYINMQIDGTNYLVSIDYMGMEFKTKYNMHDVELSGWLYGSFKSFIYVLPVEVKDLGEHKDEVPAGAIYFSNFDKSPATQDYQHGNRKEWPWLTDFDGWVNHKGSGVEKVTYDSKNMYARTNQSSNGELSYYDGSGMNNIFFSTAPNYFTINDIAVNTQNLKLTFGAQRYAQGASNEFLKSDFVVRVSQDGETWSQSLKYDFDKEDGFGQWRVATLNFSIPAGVKNLSIKFEAKMSSVNRIDDVLLIEGEGGQMAEFGAQEIVEKSTIAEVIAAPVDNIYKIEGQIIGTHDKGFLVKDETGVILVFKKKHGQKVGSTITVEGVTTEYAGMKQFGETSTITLIGEGTYTQPQPEVLDGKKMEEYAKNPTIKYIQYEGLMTSFQDEIYQLHNNVAVDGTDIIGAIMFPAKELNIKDYDNKKIRVTGYALGMSTSADKKQLLNTMVISIEAL